MHLNIASQTLENVASHLKTKYITLHIFAVKSVLYHSKIVRKWNRKEMYVTQCFVAKEQRIKRDLLYFTGMAQQRVLRQWNCCWALANLVRERTSHTDETMDESQGNAWCISVWLVHCSAEVLGLNRNDLVATWNSSWFVTCRRAFGVQWCKKRWLRLSVEMTFK